MIRTLQRVFQRTRTSLVGPRTPTAVRPSDALQAHASGPDPIRVLLAGGDILTGWGVRSHDLAVPGHLARALSNATGRGVDISVALDPHVTAGTLSTLIRGQRLDAFDAIVLHLGLTDIQRVTTPARWTKDLTAVLRHLAQQVPPGATITVLGVPTPSSIPYLHTKAGGVLDSHAALLNAATADLCKIVSDVTFLGAAVYLPDARASHQFGRPDHFRHWADHETAHLLPFLTQAPPAHPELVPTRRCPTADTDGRMRALNGLTWNVDTDTRIERIIRRAKSLFEVDTVTFAIATVDELVHYLDVGDPVKNVPFEGSFCWDTLQQSGTHIIRDTWVVHPDRPRYPARFYAGHPVLAPDGTPIGTLCLLARKVPAEEIDCVLLRDLTLQIQQALSSPALTGA